MGGEGGGSAVHRRSQIMIGGKRRSFRLQPGLPPLCCRRALWVLHVDHLAQFLLSGQPGKSSATILQRSGARGGRGGRGLRSLTCSLANTPDLLFPKPYICMALSSSSELSLYTTCSTCQSNSSSSSSSSSPVPLLLPLETTRCYLR